MTHPEEVVPFMVRDFNLLSDGGSILAEVRNHRGARFDWVAEWPVPTRSLTLRILATHGTPAAVFRVRCFPA